MRTHSICTSLAIGTLFIAMHASAALKPSESIGFSPSKWVVDKKIPNKTSGADFIVNGAGEATIDISAHVTSGGIYELQDTSLSAADWNGNLGISAYDASWKLLRWERHFVTTKRQTYKAQYTVPAGSKFVRIFLKNSKAAQTTVSNVSLKNIGGASTAANTATLTASQTATAPVPALDNNPTTPAPQPTKPITLMGVYKGPGADGVKALPEFVHWLGRKPDIVLDSMPYTDWSAARSNLPWTLQNWKGQRLALSVPMLVEKSYSGSYWEDGKQISANYPTGTLKDGANGKFDAHFKWIAEQLVKTGHDKTILRIGWEFNGDWYPWAASKDPEAYKAYFARIVDIFRKTPGAHFVIDWNPNLGTEAINPEKAYPGDAYVDYIGLDIYNKFWSDAEKDPTYRWNHNYNRSNGIKWWVAFAKAHNKLLSVPEWGTGLGVQGGAEHGAGDDPLFVDNMAKIIRDNNVVYAGYWDYKAWDYDGRLSNNQAPQSAAMFLKWFK